MISRLIVGDFHLFGHDGFGLLVRFLPINNYLLFVRRLGVWRAFLRRCRCFLVECHANDNRETHFIIRQLKKATSTKSFQSQTQVTVLRIFVCVLMCLVRWSDRMNFFVHSGHWNRFSPVWVRRCRCSSSDLVNFLPQKIQLQTNGRSPVCHLKCALKWLVLP